jgi:O-antigen ligase
MSEQLRALTVILVLASLVFALAKGPICSAAMKPGDFVRRRNLWFLVTLISFGTSNFWVYILAVGGLLWWARTYEHNPLALYFAMLFAVPPISAPIEALGIVEYIISINHIRLLALVILLPTWLELRRRSDVKSFGSITPDKFIIAYLLLMFFLGFRSTTITDGIRYGFYLFFDAFLPYYVASRAFQTLDQFREALAAFLLSAILLAVLGFFELAKGWLLYSTLAGAWEIPWDMGRYLTRGGGEVRALVTTGQPIVLGYIMVVAIALYQALSQRVPDGWRLIGLLLLIVGLIAPVSRGPWIGAALIPFLLAITGPRPSQELVRVGLWAGIIGIVILVSPFGPAVLDRLPFIGNVDADNVVYRQRLFVTSIEVIKDNLLFGTSDALQSYEMEALRQGGIIDLVNSYLVVALSSGIVGLSLFVAFFGSSFVGLIRSLRAFPNRDDDSFRLGQALLVALLAALVVISTVSSISAIPMLYWMLAGFGVRFASMSECTTSYPMTVFRRTGSA